MIATIDVDAIRQKALVDAVEARIKKAKRQRTIELQPADMTIENIVDMEPFAKALVDATANMKEAFASAISGIDASIKLSAASAPQLDLSGIDRLAQAVESRDGVIVSVLEKTLASLAAQQSEMFAKMMALVKGIAERKSEPKKETAIIEHANGTVSTITLQ